MWLIVSLVSVLSAAGLILQLHIVLLLQVLQLHESNMTALKEAVAARNNARARYRRMKLRYVSWPECLQLGRFIIAAF